MAERTFLFTSESVTEGHPDKIADQISDAVLDAALTNDPMSRVACETLITTGLVVVAGEMTTDTYIDIPRLVRETVKGIGYTRAKYGFDAETCGVVVAIDEQSPDIAQGVDKAYELTARPGRRRSARQRRRRRPGDDVRLRVERDARADAAADHAGAPHRQAALRGAQGRRAAVPAPRRQGPGVDPLRRRRRRQADAGRDRARADLDAAPRRARSGGDDQARPDRARAPSDPPEGSLRREAARRPATSSTSTRPASS